MNCDPRHIAALVRAGDQEGLEALTRCHGDKLLAVGRHYCRNSEEAEDAVQDALLTASTHLGTYRGEGTPEGWVVRMVARACSRLRRGQKNDLSRHDVDVEIPSLEDPEFLLQRGELARKLGEGLLTLEPTDRAILLLAEGEGWTGPELSEKLGMTPVAIRSRLSRARRRLRASLEAEGP